MTETYITVTFENLEAFWSEMIKPNSWVQRLCKNYERYPKSNFGVWLTKNNSTKRMVVTDYIEFELRIKGREPNKKAKHRINTIIDRLTKKSERKFNVLLYSQKLTES